MRSFSIAIVAAYLTGFAAAHGVVAEVTVEGVSKPYKGYVPSNAKGTQPVPAGKDVVVWASNNKEQDFLTPKDYATDDIICHRKAMPAPAAAEVAAGKTITLSWPNWPKQDPHPGVFLNYLAPAGTDTPSSINKQSLKFVKISQKGYDPTAPVDDEDFGLATYAFKKAGLKAQVTIPANIKPGLYVLRHEIIALHEANEVNGAQNYPQCVTIKVTGGGSAVPAGVAATTFYKATDPGIKIDLYDNWKPQNYKLPGPAVYNGATGTAAAAAGSVVSGTGSAASSAGSASSATSGKTGTGTSNIPSSAPSASSSGTSGGSSSGSSGSSSSGSHSGRHRYRHGGRFKHRRAERRHAREQTNA